MLLQSWLPSPALILFPPQLPRPSHGQLSQLHPASTLKFHLPLDCLVKHVNHGVKLAESSHLGNALSILSQGKQFPEL